MDPATIALLASTAYGAFSGSRQQKALKREEDRAFRRGEKEARRAETATAGVRRDLLRERGRLETLRSARDPFAEHAAMQGALQQAGGGARVAEQRGLGHPQMARQAAQAQAQAMLARESLRLQREQQYGQALQQTLGQLGELTQSGIRTRASIIGGYEDRAAAYRTQRMQMGDPVASALAGGVQAYLAWDAEKDPTTEPTDTATTATTATSELQSRRTTGPITPGSIGTQPQGRPPRFTPPMPWDDPNHHMFGRYSL